MRTIGVLLSVLCLHMGATGFAAEKVDLAKFLEEPGKYDGKEILVSGFLSLEDYGKALFLTREDYVQGRFGNSVPVIVPYRILNRREAFQRTFVRIRAVYDHDCARPERFCSAHPGQGVLHPVRELRRLRRPENGAPVFRKSAIGTVWDELSVSKAGHPDYEGIMRLALKFADAVRTEDKAALAALVENSVRKAVEADLNTPASRSNWLLFSGPYNYKSAFRPLKKSAVIPLRIENDPVRPPVAAACYCVRKNCAQKLATPLPSDAVTTGSFVDPYKCVPFHKSERGWVIDAGFLISFGAGMPHDDLGSVITEDPATDDGKESVIRAFTHPPAYSSFSTRLRERPRPRVVNALRTGRLTVPVDFVTPGWTLYSLQPKDGRVVLEKLKDLGTGEKP